MRGRFIHFLIFLFISSSAVSQIWPEPGAKLNFTQVMFEYGSVKGAIGYVVQIIQDTAGATFQHPTIEQKDLSTATLINDLKFGQKYVWRYAGIMADNKVVWNGPYNFETLPMDTTGGGILPVNVVVNDSAKNAKGLIVADFESIINRAGIRVWQFPSSENKFTPIRDFRVTPAGTLTFLSPSGAIYECDLRGNIIWKGPNDGKVSGDATELYHHDFQRLPNGHYVVLSTKQIWKKVPDEWLGAFQSMDTLHASLANKIVDGQLYCRIDFGTIIEYDKQGKVVWSWNSESYFKDADIFPLVCKGRPPAFAGGNGTPALPRGKGPPPVTDDRDTHLNAFSVDEKNEFIYAGFREISRVVKIERKTGLVVESWGETGPVGGVKHGDGFFEHQHGTSLLKDGSIAVFDNADVRQARRPARAVIFSQESDSGHSKLLWEYECIFDSIALKGGRGGNVDELPNGNILVSMGMGPIKAVSNTDIPAAALPSPQNADGVAMGRSMFGGPTFPSHIFEVTRLKQLVWSATVAKSLKPAYRAHYVSSLYPCYFTVGCDKEGIYRSADFFTVTIYNKGSENDSYIISTRFVKAGNTTEIECNDIPAGELRNVRIAPGKLPIADDDIEVIIKSKTNPDFERKLKLFFHK